MSDNNNLLKLLLLVRDAKKEKNRPNPNSIYVTCFASTKASSRDVNSLSKSNQGNLVFCYLYWYAYELPETIAYMYVRVPIFSFHNM